MWYADRETETMHSDIGRLPSLSWRLPGNGECQSRLKLGGLVWIVWNFSVKKTDTEEGVCQNYTDAGQRIVIIAPSGFRPRGSTEDYSAFRQKFPKLWTSVAHSFLQQIAQNKNWAHPKATTLPQICTVEMQQASLLYYSAKPQSGGIWGCALVCPTSLYVRTIRFPTFCRSLSSVGAYSQYPAWSGCRRSVDVPRADHDRVGSSPLQGGFKERVHCACLPSICLIFSTCKYAATAFNFKHKKTINVTDLSWPKTFGYRFSWSKASRIRYPKTETTPLNSK